jgi:hypothetical protein
MASEGFVVEFFPGTSESWVCNFVGGVYEPVEHHSGIVPHPNGEQFMVFSAGTMFLVSPAATTVEVSEERFVSSVLEWPEGNSVFLGKVRDVDAIGPDGLVWSKGVALDYAFVERIEDGELIIRFFDYNQNNWKEAKLHPETGRNI